MSKRSRSPSLLEMSDDEIREYFRKRARLEYESRPLVDLDETFERIDTKSFPTCPSVDEFEYEIPDRKHSLGGGGIHDGTSGVVFAGHKRNGDSRNKNNRFAIKITKADMQESDDPNLLPLCSSREESLAREMTIARHLGEIGAGPVVHGACIDRNGHWSNFIPSSSSPLGVIVSDIGTRLNPVIGLGNLDRASHAIHTAHEHGIVHGDLHPNNVVMVRGQPVLIDTGRSFYTSDPLIIRNEQERLYKLTDYPRFIRKGEACRMY